MADSVAPALAIGISVGRIGCFLNGCCSGKPARLPWGIRVHPAQLYESLAMLFVFLFVWKIRKKNFAPGFIFSAYLLLWGGERFLIEFLRTTTPSPFCSLSMAQVASLAIVILALFILLRSAKKEDRISPDAA
jgi:phosphatidylglycerol:prolipoprotein diacylglycerol transferase